LATTLNQLRASGEFKDSTATPAPIKASVTPEDKSIRPFRIHVPEAALVDLLQRLAATRLPERETVGDQSQGVQLATMKELVRDPLSRIIYEICALFD
jgi:hypothetical protein